MDPIVNIPETVLSALEEKTGIIFKNKQLLIQAARRCYDPTIGNQMNLKKRKWLAENENQRLEFLGDAIVGYAIADYIYTHYPKVNEGRMTNLRTIVVKRATLASVAVEIGFLDLITLSADPIYFEHLSTQWTEKLLADTYEAYVGAIRVDQGYEIAAGFIRKTLCPILDDFAAMGVFFHDPLNKLFSNLKKQKSSLPVYKLLSEPKPPNQSEFVVGLFFNEILTMEGRGWSFLAARKDAALNFLRGELKKPVPYKSANYR